MTRTALVVGGTAATGAPLIQELTSRGYDVTVYHRGTHEIPDLAQVEHIHGDPHFAESIEKDLAGRSWDVTVATYGRIRHLARSLRGRTGHLVTVSGMPAVKVLPGVPIDERDPEADPDSAPAGIGKLLPRILQTEHEVLDAHRNGHFAATVVRYPYVYGPYAVVPAEWHVVRRALDRRPRWILQGAGLAVEGRCAAPNAARLIALILDQPGNAGGKVFHAADDRQYTRREWVEIVGAAVGHRFEFVDVPAAIAPLGCSAVPMSGEYTWADPADVAAGILRHSQVSSAGARAALGYRDAVNPAEWMAVTARHWIDHQPTVDGQVGRMSPEEFDYAAEDRLLAWWDGVLAIAPDDLRAAPLRGHSYDHPGEKVSK